MMRYLLILLFLIGCSNPTSSDPENLVAFYVEADPGNEIELTVNRNGEDLDSMTASDGDKTDNYKAEVGDEFTGRVCSDGDDSIKLYITLNEVDVNVLNYGNHSGERRCSSYFTTEITQETIDWVNDQN